MERKKNREVGGVRIGRERDSERQRERAGRGRGKVSAQERERERSREGGRERLRREGGGERGCGKALQCS